MSKNKEVWKTIRFAPKYEVSNMGRIRNKVTKKCLSTRPTKSHKHPQVFLHGCGVFPKMQFTVSHIVYDHFVGEEGFNNTTGNWNARIMHYDGNILNNNSNNLFRRC